jgi:hypothetical protein
VHTEVRRADPVSAADDCARAFRTAQRVAPLPEFALGLLVPVARLAQRLLPRRRERKRASTSAVNRSKRT